MKQHLLTYGHSCCDQCRSTDFWAPVKLSYLNLKSLDWFFFRICPANIVGFTASSCYVTHIKRTNLTGLYKHLISKSPPTVLSGCTKQTLPYEKNLNILATSVSEKSRLVVWWFLTKMTRFHRRHFLPWYVNVSRPASLLPSFLCVWQEKTADMKHFPYFLIFDKPCEGKTAAGGVPFFSIRQPTKYNSFSRHHPLFKEPGAPYIWHSRKQSSDRAPKGYGVFTLRKYCKNFFWCQVLPL